MTAHSSTQIVGRKSQPWWNDGVTVHRILLRLAWAAVVLGLISLAVYGFRYYVLPLSERAHSPLHGDLRPSGFIGLRLGLLGLCLFFLLFLYPVRKRWPWLSRIGKTKHWLNFHVLLGVAAPIVITFHSTLKFGGIAGMSYWIMAAVSLSGFVGRYLYGQIPRSVHTTDLTLREMEDEQARLASQLESQSVLTSDELDTILRLPAREKLAKMGVLTAVWNSLIVDMSRSIRVVRIRQRYLHPSERIATLGGLLPSRHRDLEAAISTARAHAWLTAKLAFLNRTKELFHLWHVVHRPFSLAFIILVVLHISVAVLFGYFR